MRGLLWLLTLAALAVGLSLAARYNDGYVLFVLPPWRVELSLNLLLVMLGAAFVFLYLLLRAVINTLGLPDKVRAFRLRRGREKAAEALADAVWMFNEGRYSRAITEAERASDLGYRPGLAALVAQRAAHAMRDGGREEAWRERARQHDGEVRAARLMTEAELALEARDYASAHEALNRLAATEGRHLAALRLSWRAEQGLGNWPEVLRLTRLLEKHGAMSAEQAAPIRQRAHRELIAQISDPAQLERYWDAMPAADRREPRLLLQAVNVLHACGNCRTSARMIEDFLEERWDSAVVAAYGDCEDGDTLACIAHAEKWLATHPRDEQLLIALGRFCRRQKLWGKAQSYLEASLFVRPTRRAHIELAQLLEGLERAEEAMRHYRAAAVAP